MLIADEVQSGMGRTGKWWACDHAGIEPDIICTAKGIASGMPLGASSSRASIMNWKPGSHASTFGGNPVPSRLHSRRWTCSKRQYIENARAWAKHILSTIADWRERHKIVGDVRGRA